MSDTIRQRAEIIAGLVHLKQRLVQMERAPAQTISERIVRTDACSKARSELARLEKRLNAIIQTIPDARHTNEPGTSHAGKPRRLFL